MTNRATHIQLIVGGQYHDMDYARLFLLRELARFDRVRTVCAPGYDDLTALEKARALITYTCNVVPNADQVTALTSFLEAGGRWLALHGTNSILAQNDQGRWYAPVDKSGVMALLGSQFAAHPPIAPYEVHIDKDDDPLVNGLSDFVVEGGDELYYMRLFGEMDVIMSAKAQGAARGFVERAWPSEESHPVLYRKAVGKGEIVYLTLGHRRSHYDMEPLVDYYPTLEKGAWEIEPYQKLLDNCLRWAVGFAG